MDVCRGITTQAWNTINSHRCGLVRRWSVLNHCLSLTLTYATPESVNIYLPLETRMNTVPYWTCTLSAFERTTGLNSSIHSRRLQRLTKVILLTDNAQVNLIEPHNRICRRFRNNRCQILITSHWDFKVICGQSSWHLKPVVVSYLTSFVSNITSLTVFEIFEVKFLWPGSRTVQGQPRTKVMMPIDTPWMVSCWTSVDSIIVAVNVFEIFDVKF